MPSLLGTLCRGVQQAYHASAGVPGKLGTYASAAVRDTVWNVPGCDVIARGHDVVSGTAKED